MRPRKCGSAQGINSVKMATCGEAKHNTKDLTCTVCLEEFREPKVLPCCHTFCKGCLERILEKSKTEQLICPQCRTEHEVPESGAAGFLTDFSLVHDLHVLQVMQTKDASPVCGECDSTSPSTAYCATCEAFLCDFCCTAHKKMKHCRNHEVLLLQNVTTESLKPSLKTRYCAEHAEEALKLYCENCQKLICRDCTLVVHHRHSYKFVKDARQAIQSQLHSLTEGAEVKLAKLRKDLAFAKEIETFVESYPESLQSAINTTFESFIAMLKARQAELLSQVEDECQKDKKAIWAHKEHTESAIANLTSSINFAERVLHCGNDVEMLSLALQAIPRLQSLKGTERKTKEMSKVAMGLAIFNTHEHKELQKIDSIHRYSEKVCIQVTDLPLRADLDAKIKFGVKCNIAQLTTVAGMKPKVKIQYGKSKQAFKEFTISEVANGWAVELNLICGGVYLIIVSVGKVFKDNFKLTVKGKPSVGARVRPGPDWKDSKQKHDHHGTVTKVHTQSDYYTGASTSVKVEWDDKSFGSVRYPWGPSYPIELVPTQAVRFSHDAMTV